MLAKPATLQYPSYLGRVVGYAELPLNDLGNPTPRPNLPAEPEGGGSPRQQLRELPPLLVAQLGRPTRRLAMTQGLRAALPGLADPLAHCSFGDAQRCGHIFLLPTLLDQLPSTQPAGLLPIAGRFNHNLVHGVDYHHHTSPLFRSLLTYQ